ncbi:ScbR family autoregulator-binding transcription factor [Saccharopolyspora phatthalungensis]|uniref:AcrR family transcriptional regulator n=1 Tax=Saccharopolyspora phatthalungensis TaxID=664693 RepID=A0A840Q247_9PSEU|nr:ScbR family autoregulator-binding transcription factor [Saccharopolyspora phatthalungensis]MBB5154586.1 AcrR family transcriptional regulator [Saccharopolyspora phatthalungensis]
MPQQHRAKLTRRAILVGAAEEFDVIGYDAATLSSILRRCGITKGAFYFHFADKEAVAEALARQYLRNLAEMRKQWFGRGLDPLSTLVGLTGEAARRVERDVVLRSGLLLACQRIGAESGDGWDEVFDELVRKAAEAGQLRPGVDPAEAARVLYAALVGAHAVGDDPVGLADRFAEVWRVVLAGVAGEGWGADAEPTG